MIPFDSVNTPPGLYLQLIVSGICPIVFSRKSICVISSRLMIAPNYKIKKPIFGTYEDLDEIVESVFKLFEDFKKAMTAS